jgi:site-specific DNA recombinase
MLDAVYVDDKEEKRIVAIRPKPPFRPVFQVATTKEGSGVILLNGPPESHPEAPSCFWWRWGRVELPVQRKWSRIYYRFS